MIQSLADAYPNDIELVGHYFDFLGRKGVIDNLPKAANIRYRRTVVLPGKVFNMLRRLKIPVFYEFLVGERGDFLLFPNFIGWPSLFRTPSAPYIHDITYIDLPDYVSGPNLFDLRTQVPGVLRRSSFTITNTQSSKNGLATTYPWYKKPYIVAEIPLVEAVKVGVQESRQRVASLGINKPYLLFFGTLEPRKNIVGLLRAYSLLSQDERSHYSLVLAGGKGWNDQNIHDTLDKMQSEGYDIIQTGYTSNEDRAALYMNAEMLVLPSHYEGFGMQLLEAMFYKTPMVVSDIPVLREVAKDVAVYCQTTPESIAGAIQSLLNNTPLRKSLIGRGTVRLKDFSWENVASKIYQAITKALNR